MKLKLTSFEIESFTPAIAEAPIAVAADATVVTRQWDEAGPESGAFWPTIARRVGHRSYYLVSLRLREYSTDSFDFCGRQELDRFAHAEDGLRLFHPLYQRDF